MLHPGHLKLNQWALTGEWIMGKESVRLIKSQGIVKYSFHGRDLHLILGSAKSGSSIKFRVLINGNPPGEVHGLDVDSNGYGTVTDQRMYQLIRQDGPIVDKEFQIEFLDPEVEVFDFT